MTLSTRVTRLLGITQPVIQAGMSVHTSPELVAAVSNAGGLGLVGSVFREPDDLHAAVNAVRNLTDRPFGANIVLAEPWQAYLDILLAEGVPVVAAGGIADGRGLAAALLLGADGVLIGTRFLATLEASVPEGWKRALLVAHPEDAWQTDVPDILDAHAWPGATVRVLANAPVHAWHGHEAEIAQYREQIRASLDRAWQADEADGYFLYAGQSAGLVHDIIPAAEVVRRMVQEAEDALRGICSSTR